MQINFSWNSSVSAAPAAFKTAMQAAANILDSVILDPITVTLQVGWGESGGTPISGTTGGAGGVGAAVPSTYTQLTGALRANATANGYSNIVANLPAADPTQGGNWWVGQAQAKALNILGPYGSAGSFASAFDGGMGFSSDASAWCFDTSQGIGANQADFMGTALHEITHALGRIPSSATTSGSVSLSLYSYASPGKLQLVNGQPAYFSLDGGTTNLSNFDMSSGGDPIDWASSVPYAADSFNASNNRGILGRLTSTDLLVMQALGYKVAPIYSITGAASVDEGAHDLLTLHTSALPPGTVLNYTVGGISASRLVSGSLNGSVTIAADGTGTIDLGIKANHWTDGATTAVVSVANGQASFSVAVNDTSLAPAAAQAPIPVLVAQNQTVSLNATIPASSLISSVSDAYGYPISSYHFLDNGGGSGYFSLNGIKQANSFPNTVTKMINVAATDLSKLVYVGGTAAGTDNIEVTVWDGLNFAKHSFVTVTTSASLAPPLPVTPTTVAKVTLDSGMTYIAASPATVYGSGGTETVKVQDGVAVNLDANVERVEFAGAASAYTYKATSTGVQVYLNGTLEANAVNGEKLAFADGSASVMASFNAATGAVDFTLGGASVPAAAGAVVPALNTADKSGVGTIPTPVNGAPAKIILDPGMAYIAASPATIYGSSGTETVKVQDGVAVTTDANVERVEFARAASGYTYQATSTGVQVYLNGVLEASVVNGEKLAFADGSATVMASFNAATGAIGFTLGGAPVPSAAGGVVPTLNIAPGEASTFTVAGGTNVVTLAAGGTVFATAGSDYFRLPNTLANGSAVTISGAFDVTMDRIQVPAGSIVPAAVSGAPVNALNDGNVDLQWNNNGAVVTIHLVGLPVGGAAELALQAGTVPAVFGTY